MHYRSSGHGEELQNTFQEGETVLRRLEKTPPSRPSFDPLLLAVLESLPLAIVIICTRDGKVVRYNRRFAELWGLDRHPNAVSGSEVGLEELFPLCARQVAEPEALASACATIHDGQSEATIEKEIALLDGRHIRLLSSPIRDSDGRLAGRLCAFEDITPQYRSRVAQRESEEKYRQVFAAEPNALLLLDLESFDILDANDAAVALYGYSREEFLQLKGTDLTTNPERAVKRASQAEAGQALVVPEAWHRRKDGSLVPVEVSASVFELSGRRLACVAARDITERIEAAEALRESERRYRDLADSLPQTVYEMDAEGKITYVNRNAFATWGYSPDDLAAGLHALQMIAPEDRERARQNIARSLSGNLTGPNEYLGQRKDGSVFPVTIHATPIVREGRLAGLRGIIVDITERKQLEEQLLQARKLESIGRLAGGVAHDFNNLLTALFGYTEMALAVTPAESPAYRHLQGIRQVSERAASLTRQLLAFARKQMIQPRVLDLNGLLSQVFPLLRRLIREDITLELSLNAPRAYVRVDPGQLEQVLVNLAVNARDAMPDGGTLTIATACETVEARAPHLPSDITPGDYVILRVSDTGMGMSEAVRSRIFEPFFTTKEQGKGTGLGLATVYGIIKQSEGHVAVRSRPGAGTTFCIYLPQVVVDPESDTDGRVSALSLNGTETILLVEDEPVVRHMASEALRSRGYQLLEAEDGEEALRVLRRAEGAIALVITDVVMPHMGGLELAEHLRREYPRTRILFVSGYSDRASSLITSPTEDFLHKPFTPDRLAQKVRELLDKPLPHARPGEKPLL